MCVPLLFHPEGETKLPVARVGVYEKRDCFSIAHLSYPLQAEREGLRKYYKERKKK
jgi:hypothetical protein